MGRRDNKRISAKNTKGSVSFESDPLLDPQKSSSNNNNGTYATVNNNNHPSEELHDENEDAGGFSSRSFDMLSERSSELSRRLLQTSGTTPATPPTSEVSSSDRWTDLATILKAGNNFSDVLKLITLSGRQKALSHKGVGEAAFLIRDAVLGNVENPAEGAYDPYIDPSQVFRNAVSVICRRICSSRPVLQILHGTAWILLFLSFVEPPSWCRKDWYQHADHLDGCQAILSAKGVAATSENSTDVDNSPTNEVEYYPNSHAMLLTMNQSAIVESIGLGIIFTILLLRFGRDGMSIKTYLRRGVSQVNRIIQLVCIIAMMVGLIIDRRTLHPFLRLALLISFLTGVQKDLGILWKMLPEILNVLLLLGVFTAFYAWFGCVMFVGTEEGEMHFPSFLEGMWTLWICVTTANYPDVMMPSYNENRWTAVYFVSFMVLSFFFLMNVVLASVVSEYDSAMGQRREKREALSQKNLRKAFAFLDPEGTGRISRDSVMSLFVILNEDFPEFKKLSEDDCKLLFAILDKDGTNQITEEEFMDFGNIMLIEFTKTSDYATFIERNFPKFFASPSYQRFSQIVKSQYFEYAIDCILVLNACVILIQSYPELSGAKVTIDPKLWDGSIDTVWELIESVFTGIYALEVIVKILVFGWKKYVESTKNVFDITITCLAVVSTAIVYYPNAFSDSRIIRMIVLARVLRLTRLLTAIKRFQLIGMISAEILPAARNIVLLLFLLMYLFSAAGVSLFGGLISRDPQNELSYRVLDTEFSDNDYWSNNFNDFISSMNVLFNLLVVNNWTECADGFEAVTQSKLPRLFFFFFHVLGVILINNLVIAFIINEFMAQLTIFRENTEAEVVGDGEAVLYHGEAVFEGSTITGTNTSLEGNYIARIRHTGGEGRDHERLKKMFTQTSSADSDRGINSADSERGMN